RLLAPLQLTTLHSSRHPKLKSVTYQLLYPSQRSQGQGGREDRDAIVAIVERLKTKGAQASAEEAKFTRDGKAEIQVWLTDKSAATIEQLKKLGFEVILDPQASKVIIGRLPVENLAALAERVAVKYIAPQTQ